MNSRLTYNVVSTLMDAQKAREEFEYTKRNILNGDEISSVRGTLEEWNGREWVIKDTFEHENR